MRWPALVGLRGRLGGEMVGNRESFGPGLLNLGVFDAAEEGGKVPTNLRGLEI